MQSEAFVRADDTAAIETAKQLIAYGRDVRDRKVTKLIGIASPSMEQARAAREELGLSSLRANPSPPMIRKRTTTPHHELFTDHRPRCLVLFACLSLLVGRTPPILPRIK